MSYLLWLLPIVLIALIIYRFQAKKPLPAEKSNMEFPPLIKSRFAKISLAVISLLLIGYFFIVKPQNLRLFSPSGKCPVSITPEMFNDMVISDEKSIAGYFHDCNFTRVSEVLNPDDSNSRRTIYRYRLHDTGWGAKDESSREIDYVLEFAYTYSYPRGIIYYVFDNHKKYDAYTDYLKFLQADSLISSAYINYEDYLDSTKATYHYKKLLFEKIGFSPNLDGYVYKILSYDSLTPKLAELQSTNAPNGKHVRDRRIVKKEKHWWIP